jgi:long-chain acyl-CoA synthetase
MAETKQRFEKLTNSRILEGYSLTEAAMALCVNPYRGANKIGSVGMPLPDVAVRIVYDETGLRELPIGQTGEVVFTAPQIMQGYWSNPEETAATLRIMSDGSTGLYTGDLGYLDSDGYLFLVDRKKDLIKTSGLQVWPREVEEVLATHPAVSEVGVGGVPDEHKGERVVAWVVLRPGFSATATELRAFCKEKLAPFKIPSRIEFRTELPKTMVGKVLRRALVAEAKAAATAQQPVGAV